MISSFTAARSRCSFSSRLSSRASISWCTRPAAVVKATEKPFWHIEALYRRKARLANAPFDDPPLPVDELQFDQTQQIGRVIDPLARGLPGHLVILAQNRRQPELLQVMREEELWRSARRARWHRLRCDRLVGLLGGAHARLPDTSTA